jgi:two-component system response regulator DesR
MAFVIPIQAGRALLRQRPNGSRTGRYGDDRFSGGAGDGGDRRDVPAAPALVETDRRRDGPRGPAGGIVDLLTDDDLLYASLFPAGVVAFTASSMLGPLWARDTAERLNTTRKMSAELAVNDERWGLVAGGHHVRLAREYRPDIAALDLEMPPADACAPPSRSARTCPHRSSWSPGTPPRGAAPGAGDRRPGIRAQDDVRGQAGGDHPRRRRRARLCRPDIAASALTEDDCPLTDREPEVLRAARTGASVNDIAAEVHLAAGTVRNYLSAAMSKLGATSRHAAAHYAWQQGWI